jgi:hypothetical protein
MARKLKSVDSIEVELDGTPTLLPSTLLEDD